MFYNAVPSLSHKLAITSDPKSALVLEIKASKDIYTLNYEAFNLAVSGRFDLVKKLTNFRSRYWDKWVDYTPLMRAIHKRKGLDFIRKLVECGEPIAKGISDDGFTALDYAYENMYRGGSFDQFAVFDMNDALVFDYLYKMSQIHEGITEYRPNASILNSYLNSTKHPYLAS